MATILNIAAGKIPPIDKTTDPTFVVNVDPMFFRNDTPEAVEAAWQDWTKTQDCVYNIKADAFGFMERTVMLFDQVCIYRFLEHIPFDRVPYFIYLISTITEPADIVDVIVPNYTTLAKMILAEGEIDELENFEAHNILLTTELLNEPSCPHASIWTVARAQYFWELEGRFDVIDTDPHYEFDGRNIYLRFKARRI